MIRLLLQSKADPTLRFIVYGKDFADVRKQAKKFIADYIKNRKSHSDIFATFPLELTVGGFD